MMSLGTAKLTHAAASSTESNKISLQAQQYAVSEASFLKSLAYSDLKPVSKQSIAGSDFKKEVTWSNETTSSSTQQKTATVKIYKGDETLPRAELNLTRYNTKVSSVPIGTIIAWASTKNPTDGTWLECNGQSCSSYPELAKVLGTNTVPDYRGVFLRGLGNVNSTHYGNVTHQSGTLGELQGDSIRNITGWIGNCEEFSSPIDATSVGKPIDGEYHYPHDLGAFAVEKTVGGAYGGLWQIQGTGYKQTNGNSVLWSDKVQGGFNFQLNTSLVVPTSNENRPINRAIRYFIRAA